MFKTACATIALIALANPALAAGCVTPKDAAALKTAVMQQALMVAAFQCREASAYNGFVTIYRKELQSSDAVLKAFFVQRGGGESGYDRFKTKAANIDSEDGSSRGGDLPRNPQDCSIATKYQEQVHLFAQSRVILTDDCVGRDELMSDGVGINFAAGSGYEPCSLFYNLGAGGLIRIADQSYSLEFICHRFQSEQEILYYPPGLIGATLQPPASGAPVATQILPLHAEFAGGFPDPG